MPTTIADLEAPVLRKVENRTSDTTLADEWIRDALLEIASNPDYRDDFVELEVLALPFNLVVGQTDYADSNFVPAASGTTQSGINDATLDIMIWNDPPTNSLRRRLDVSHYQEQDKLQTSVNSTPIQWCRFGQNISFYPPPDNTYQVQGRALQQHPINGTLRNTVILLPIDWNEVIVYAAAMRGFNDLGMYDAAASLKLLIYGDPKYPSLPGLIQGRKKKRAREAWRSTDLNRLRPRIHRVSYHR